MSETAPAPFLARPDDDIERGVSTAGGVLPHVEAKSVVPADGRTVPRGERGEVCTRGYMGMRGYWDDPASTADAVDEAGGMHAEDLGVMDAEGYLNIVGRIKDMAIRGGGHQSPPENEQER